MKRLLLFSTLIFLFSCRKDINAGIFTGDTTNLIITNHDTLIDANYNGVYDLRQYNMDLDGNGSTDLRFYSSDDSISNPIGAYYGVYMHTAYDEVDVLEVAGSKKQYITIDTVDDYYGTFPRKTFVQNVSCDSTQGSYLYNESNVFNSANCLSEGVNILSYSNWENESIKIELIREDYQTAYWNFSIGGDSLIGLDLSREELCTSAPLDEIFYLAFRITLGGQVRYGWIELIITEHNALYISRSAITAN